MALSHKGIRALLELALGDPPARGYISIHDVWPDKFVYTVSDHDRNASETYERTYAIDPDQKVTLGDARRVRAVTNYEPVVFSGIAVDTAVFSESGTHEARLFRIGDYPEKSFSLSAQEADAAVASFSPIPILLEHGSTAIGNVEFGEVESIRREGDRILGTTRFLPAAREKLKGTAPKLSMSFFRDTKRPKEASVVEVPHVAEAGLLAAFSDTPEPHRKNAAPARTGSAMGVFGTFISKIIGAHKPTDAEVEAMDAQFSAAVAAPPQPVPATEKAGESAPANFSIHLAKREAERIVAGLREGRFVSPAEEPTAVAAFSAAIAAAPANFSAAGDLVESDLVKSIRESYEAREPHRYTERISASFSAAPAPAKADAPAKIDHVKAVADYNVSPQGGSR